MNAASALLFRSLASALVLMIASGCAPLPRPALPETPCQGALFDADHPAARCLVQNSELMVPPKDALAIRTVPTPAVIRRGQEATFVLELRNQSGAPLNLEIDDSCLAFEASAHSASASSFESDCGGLCARAAKKLHITLEPRGVVRKAVHFAATRRQITGDDCTEKDLGPLPAGRYTLEVTLPWTDPAPIAGNAQARASRIFKGPLIVEP